MVEFRVDPRHRVMTGLARRRETCVWHRADRIAVIVLVARNARRAGDVVVVVDVAIRTLPRRHRVRSGQWKCGLGVIEGRRLPRGRVVAEFASLREPALHVVRVGRALEVFQVARNARCRRDVVVVVDVAFRALPWRHGMRSSQRKVDRAVVERGRRPRRCGMALLASLGEGCRDVIRVRRALKVFQMARHASRACKVVVIVDVTVGALCRRHRVPSGQGKACRGMIELRVQPAVRPVTLLASDRELARDVIRIARTLEVCRVARIAVRRHGLELAVGRPLVAGIAVDCRVGSGQRKTVIVLLHLLNRDLPSPYCVALLAVRTQLPLVNVGVAILAALPDVREHGLYVALHAGDRLMHTAQGISGLIVIELWNGADRPPRTCRVAVLAGNVQIAVRTVCTSGGLRPCRRSGQRQ